MSRQRLRFRALLPLLAIALGGCGGEPPALEVGGIAFSEQALLGISPARREVLASLAAFAAAVGGDELEAVAAPLGRRAEATDLLRTLWVEEILAEADVDDEVLAERYRTNPAWELTVRHLIVLSGRYETDETRTAARAKAEAALARIRAGEAFPDVAAEVSEEPGAEGREGLLEPGREGAWVDEFWSAANALAVGEISPVVETQYGFHVLRLEGRDTVPFEEVRRSVAADVAGMIAPLPSSITDAPLPGGLRIQPPGEETPATFDGGRVERAALRDWAATLPPDRWDAFLAGDESARSEAAELAARAAAVRIRAQEAGIEPDPSVAAGARGAWATTAEGWAGALGFAPGLGGDALRDAVLAALGRSGQLGELARGDVHRSRGLLERHMETAPVR